MILFYNKPLNELVFTKKSKKYCLYEPVSLAFLAQCLTNTSGFFQIILVLVYFLMFYHVLIQFCPSMMFSPPFPKILLSVFTFFGVNFFCCCNVEKVL